MRAVKASWKRPPSKHNGIWVDVAVEGVFHRWAQDYEEFEEGPANYTVGLVELDSGRIVKVAPETVTFLHALHDRKELSAN